MIKCENGKTELSITSDDLKVIYKAVPTENILDAMLKGVLDKTVASTIFTTDLRCIFKALVEDLGSDAAVAVITLALSHTVDELKENDDE